MNKILLFLIIFILLISAGIYFYIHSSLLVSVIPNSAPFTEKQASTKEKEQNLYKDEKMIIMNLNSKSIDNLNFKSISPDGSTVFYEIKQGDKKYIVINNKEGGKYDDISDFYSNNISTQYAYVVKKEGKVFLIVNGQKKGENYDNVLCGWTINVSNCGFSSDGSKFFYEAMKDKKRFMVINNKEEKKYDAVWKFTLSPDGNNFAYIATENGKEFMVVNNRKGKEYNFRSANIDKILGAVFSPDSTKLSYKVIDYGKQKQFIIANDKEEENYDWVWYPFFSPDSKNLTYWAKKGTKCFIVENSKEGEMYNCDVKDNKDIKLYFPPKIFSSDGKTSAYVATEVEEKFQKNFVVINNQKEDQKYDRISRFMFSPDSKNFAYIANKEGKSFAVVNGIESKKYDTIYSSGFTPDSRFFYSAATKEKNGTKLSRLVSQYASHRFVIIDSKEVKELRDSHTNTSSTLNNIRDIIFSPNGENVVYYIDVKIFTETNQELLTDERSLMVINNKEEEKYFKLSDAVFLNNNTIRYFAYDGENVYRITKILK